MPGSVHIQSHDNSNGVEHVPVDDQLPRRAFLVRSEQIGFIEVCTTIYFFPERLPCFIVEPAYFSHAQSGQVQLARNLFQRDGIGRISREVILTSRNVSPRGRYSQPIFYSRLGSEQ